MAQAKKPLMRAEDRRLQGILVCAHTGIFSENEADVHLFYGQHRLVSPAEFRQAIRDAFEAWRKTLSGGRYIADNGCNWGDAVFIPKRILLRHDIASFDALATLRMDARKDVLYSVPKFSYHHKLTVDHDEQLLDG